MFFNLDNYGYLNHNPPTDLCDPDPWFITDPQLKDGRFENIKDHGGLRKVAV